MAIEKYYRRPELEVITGFCRAQIYNLIKQGKFPKPLKIGRSSVWRESDIESWQQQVLSDNQPVHTVNSEVV